MPSLPAGAGSSRMQRASRRRWERRPASAIPDPWERGTDESADGLLRDWFPKGRSLDDVSDSEVQEACDSLSRRPRKRLNWNCPWEVYHRQSLHLL